MVFAHSRTLIFGPVKTDEYAAKTTRWRLSAEQKHRSGLLLMISNRFWKFVRVLEGSKLPQKFSLNTFCMAVYILFKNGIPGWSCSLLILSIRPSSLSSIDGWILRFRSWRDLIRLRVWRRNLDRSSDVRALPCSLSALFNDGMSGYRSSLQWNLREESTRNFYEKRFFYTRWYSYSQDCIMLFRNFFCYLFR